MKVSTGLNITSLSESGASSGGTRMDNWSVLMNLRVNSKLMPFEVNPLGFASYDAKCLLFE